MEGWGEKAYNCNWITIKVKKKTRTTKIKYSNSKKNVCVRERDCSLKWNIFSLNYQLFWNLCLFLHTANLDSQGLILHRIFYCIFLFFCNIWYPEFVPYSRYLVFPCLYVFPRVYIEQFNPVKESHFSNILIVCPVTCNSCDLYSLHILSTMAFLLVFPLGKNTTL